MEQAEGIVVVGSCGLAVRILAPHMRGKDRDPAVVVLDETAQWSVALLSGHLGGAVALARRVARVTGAKAVITTATDNRGIAAPDSLARERGWIVENPKTIVKISSALLEGLDVGWDGPDCPPGYGPTGRTGVVLSPFVKPAPFAETLWLRPPAVTCGIGCRRGAAFESLADDFYRACAAAGLSPRAVSLIASVDLKADEPALLQLAKYLNLPFETYSPDRLAGLSGDFSLSPKALEVLGIDCPCERAAVAGGRILYAKKWIGCGSTFAFAVDKEWFCDR